ncbi:glycosyltransferase family 2 protein [Aquirufa novilacunae]|uniref:Glycosyltransferase family 2 protein n=1 Tax=Aquirufa novilacunae TaxID=3139305 RepID=A0ABW8U1Y7_9BACT
MEKKISIITVCFNSVKTIEETIRSVISQTYSNFEYILIDGGSTDGTLEVISNYKNHISKLVVEEDHGIYDAINKGIILSTGDIVGILNSDDCFASNEILFHINNIFLNSQVDMCWGDVNFLNYDGQIVRKYSSSFFSKNKLRFGIMPAHPTFYCKKELFEISGIYRTDLKIAADFELILRFVLKNYKYCYLPLTMVNMKIGGISTKGFKSTLTIIKEIHFSCKCNRLYTNYFFLVLKYPFKIFEFSIFNIFK